MPDQTIDPKNLRKAAETLLPSLIKAAEKAYDSMESPLWPEAGIFADIHINIEKTWQNDLKSLESLSIFAAAGLPVNDEVTQEVSDILHIWQTQGKTPSLYALCTMAMENLGVKPAPDMLNMVLTCAILGEIPNIQPYHDNTHFKKVVLHLILLIKTHNIIYEGSNRTLSDSEICLMLAAACIHDIGHDGSGNMVKGIHVPSRLEKLSFDLAKPYIEAAGIQDTGILNNLALMLLTTDVSPLDDPTNPMHQMKAAYRFHFLGEKAKAHTLNLDEDLKVLEKEAVLSTMALLLHEADIATSAGLTYEITKYETSLLREEFCGDHGKPSHVVDFLNQICTRRFLSDAGQKLYAANLARIYTLAEADLENGNQDFPESKLADFILGTSHTSTPKTIN